MDRRQFLSATVAAATGSLLSIGISGIFGRKWRLSKETHSEVRNGPAVNIAVSENNFELLTSFAQPLRDRIYVGEKTGTIYVLHEGERRVFLDLTDRVLAHNIETGLLGIALHPNYTENNRFYVRYSKPVPDDLPDHLSHVFVLSEFRANEDHTSANPASERKLLTIPEPTPMHQAGAIEFGPDGYLYVAVGDGGPGFDTGGLFNYGSDRHASDWYPINSGGNGQDLEENLLGSILRINVDASGSEKPYAIPETNPLTDESGLDEHWAWGFRNPYSMSFNDGDLYVNDVGQGGTEEVNVVRKGGNYGWNVKEGYACLDANPVSRAIKQRSGSLVHPACPTKTPDGDSLIGPAIAYANIARDDGVGSAISGGYVYDGAMSTLQGKYVFADFTGGLFASEPGDEVDKPWPVERLSLRLADTDEPYQSAITGMGRGVDGELYLLSNTLYKIVPPDS